MNEPGPNDGKTLHEVVAGLDRQKAELGAAIEAQRAENKRHQDLLDLLEGGPLEGRGRRVGLTVFLVLVVLGGGYVGYCSMQTTNRLRTRTVISRPLRPHVLITSEPPGPRARVTVTSDRMPQSAARRPRGTPFFFEAPPRGASYTFTVEADGFEPQTRALRAEPRGGVHWHAVLRPRPRTEEERARE